MTRVLFLTAAGLAAFGHLACTTPLAAAQDRQMFPRQEWPGRTNRQPPAQPVQPAPPLPVAPDPMILRLQERVDDLEAALRDMTLNQEQLQRLAATQRDQIEVLQRGLDDLAGRIAALDARQTTASVSTPGPVAAPDTIAAPAAPSQDAAPDGAPNAQAGAVQPPAAAAPNAAFKAAKDMLIRGDFSTAEAAFRGFIQAFPEDLQAVEARYWLGEALYVQASYSDAARAYLDLLRIAPQAPQAPDALVKLAASLRQSGQQADACSVLRDFARTYPNAPAATRERAQAEARAAACRG
jgi:tol-pal system protein YbgF